MKKNLVSRAALAAAISAASSGSMAAGFYLQETSGVGLGRAFAAENTIGDNASILARNPAGSALFDTITLSGGLTYIDPEIDVAGDITYLFPDGSGGLGSQTFFDTAKDYASDAFVPNGYIAVPIDPCWSVGLALFSNYGLETDFSSGWLATNINDKSELLTVNIAPSVAYKFNEQFSVGVAANFVYADAKLTTKVPANFPIVPALSNDSILRYDDADDWDVSWSLGALWDIDERTRLGISYHAEIDPDLSGDLSSDFLPTAVIPTLPLFDDARANAPLDLPDTLELGLYHRFNDQWGFAAGLTWTDWDDFETLEAFVPSARTGTDFEPFNPLVFREENFESGFRYSIAAEYYPCDQVTWRIGYAYDESAARDGLNRAETAETGFPVTWRSLAIPDTDRQWVTFGGTYEYDQHWSFDGGLAYLWGDDETIQEFTSIPVPTVFDGQTTNTEAWLLGGSVNYKF
ncbi:OmpP1/FadL family transporter [Microbulbifer sp. 2201CG32-9]|uniref:OmpP1/FadL family transporter n=1 Tax=Microbulbifer sp. 2201CG32-9 TaxID=3232309 RepID=UPI00345BCAB0